MKFMAEWVGVLKQSKYNRKKQTWVDFHSQPLIKKKRKKLATFSKPTVTERCTVKILKLVHCVFLTTVHQKADVSDCMSFTSPLDVSPKEPESLTCCLPVSCYVQNKPAVIALVQLFGMAKKIPEYHHIYTELGLVIV